MAEKDQVEVDPDYWKRLKAMEQPITVKDGVAAIKMLREVLGWLECDLDSNGPGPSGGYRLRVEMVKKALSQAEGR